MLLQYYGLECAGTENITVLNAPVLKAADAPVFQAYSFAQPAPKRLRPIVGASAGTAYPLSDVNDLGSAMRRLPVLFSVFTRFETNLMGK
jgi:hypothetical protein